MKIIINEQKIKLLENSEITIHQFKNNLKSLLKSLLSNPIYFELNKFWIDNGFSKKKLVEYLESINIIEVNKKIDNINNYNLSYKVLKTDFDSKCLKMFIKFFDKNILTKESKNIVKIVEDGAPGGAGATSCGSVGVDGKNHIDTPLFSKPIKRVIYKTNKTNN